MKTRNLPKQMPRSIREWNKLLDSILTDEEKTVVMQSDIVDLHFGLGMFIRNKWLYSASEDDLRTLVCSMKHIKEELDFVPLLGGMDTLSSDILKRYAEHLKRHKNNLLGR